ncbi:hypothetical protein KA005_27645 [bacterium]|nr:hypothetical protein [bacterium]
MTEFEKFEKFDKIARLSRNCIITEKIDGTNAQVFIGENGEFLTGSRNRWITPEDDNAGFARWALEHKEKLLQLGPGRHFGEWWGSGIQRRYGLDHKRFSLFNTGRWTEENTPDCCHVVPVLFSGLFDTDNIYHTIIGLEQNGSSAAPGFMNPEGIVIWHEAARVLFKKTIKNDEKPKGQQL